MSIYKYEVDYDLINTFSIKQLKENCLIPLSNTGIYLNYISCNTSKISFLNKSFILKKIDSSKNEIDFFLNNFEFTSVLNDTLTNEKLEKFSENILAKAIENKASDIHIEAFEKFFLIKYRIDGLLKTFFTFNKKYFTSVSSYFKMQAKLYITQIRLPQDGRFSFYFEEEKFDFRISSMPTINGESIVIRILDNQTINKDINSLGFSKNIKEEFENIYSLKQGLVLVTGPTGSGKTTTLYSLLQKIKNENKKIITVEDPVEYKLEGIQQVLVNDDIGLSFDTVLRNILRQDPDVILIGEIRDKKSLDIALQASLTGHLVLASIHANNSLETITRLIDLKVDLYALANSLKYILSQRLVLNICKNCQMKACKHCNFTGFKGRSCIAELLKVDENITSMILQKKDFKEIKEYLKENDFKPILEDGKRKVSENITTYEEVLKVVEV